MKLDASGACNNGTYQIPDLGDFEQSKTKGFQIGIYFAQKKNCGKNSEHESESVYLHKCWHSASPSGFDKG